MKFNELNDDAKYEMLEYMRKRVLTEEVIYECLDLYEVDDEEFDVVIFELNNYIKDQMEQDAFDAYRGK